MDWTETGMGRRNNQGFTSFGTMNSHIFFIFNQNLLHLLLCAVKLYVIHKALNTGWPKKNNTETNQNYTYTNDIFGIYTITICKDIK